MFPWKEAAHFDIDAIAAIGDDGGAAWPAQLSAQTAPTRWSADIDLALAGFEAGRFR
jgi:hypothetical protein